MTAKDKKIIVKSESHVSEIFIAESLQRYSNEYDVIDYSIISNETYFTLIVRYIEHDS